jgi:hypothetical protein
MQRRTMILGFSALGGCSPPVAQPIAGERLIFSQPASVPAYSNILPPKDIPGVTLWGPVEKFPCPPTAATSGAGEVHIVIDSASIPGNVAARNGLGSVVLGYSLQTWLKAQSFRFSYDLKVTRASHGPKSVAQVVAYFNLRDTRNNTSLWIGQLAWDSRPEQGGDAAWDVGTNTPFYTTAASGSSNIPYSDWRSFSYRMGANEIASAAWALRARYPKLAISSDVADYSLTHFNINPEIYAASGENARIDVSIRNWRVYQQESKV